MPNINKPMRDWTLSEAQEYCTKTPCENCLMWRKSYCELDRSPSWWRLDPSVVELTSEEKIKLTLLFNMFDKIWETIQRDKNGSLIIVDGSGRQLLLDKAEFPSIKSRMSFSVKKLLGR